MNEIRVFHCIFNSEIGGLQNGLVNLINHRHSPDIRHAVCVFETAPVDRGSCFDRIKDPQCVIFQHHRSRGNDPKLIGQLVRSIREFRPTVVHTRNWATYLEGAIAATLASTPVLIHGEHGEPSSGGQLQKWAYRLLGRRTRMVVTVSQALTDRYRATCGPWAAPVRTIHNGVDERRFAPCADRAASKAALNLPPSSPIVGCISRFSHEKGVDVLLRAVPDIVKHRPRALFVLVGHGPERAGLEALARHLGVEDQVRFVGERSDVEHLYWAMDLCISPSRTEGISNIILEALACGVPVVGTAVGGTPEILRAAGAAGVLVPSEDIESLASAIIRCLEDDRELRDRGQEAREAICKYFSLIHMVNSYENVYKEMADA